MPGSLVLPWIPIRWSSTRRRFFYLLLVLLRAAAQQSGIFCSPIDIAWEQGHASDASRSIPVAATIGDRSTINTGINCITISDSEEEGIGEAAAVGAPMVPDGTGESAAAGSMVPTEPPFPPPQSGRASHEPPWRPPRRRSTSSDSEHERVHGKRRKR